jgi:exosortase
LFAGLLALYLPMYVDLSRVFWSRRDGAYGAVMLAIVGWLVWRDRARLRRVTVTSAAGPGALLLGIGLLCYLVGRSQSFYQLEAFSQIPLLIGLCRLLLEPADARAVLFPILLLVFVIPIPGSLTDELLLPLKELVSRIVDDTLFTAGYPIARNGVVLMIGPYSLLIADACSGLNSMIALSGVGLLYVHLAGSASRYRTLLLLVSILPIALLANVLRVFALVLITFYAGDEVGAAFHDVAAYLEIAFAFGAFFTVDSLLTHQHRPMRI